MAPNASKPKSTTARGDKCLCPVCDVVDQWGIKYPREHCDKGKVVVPYLPPVAVNPDGTICELPTISPCDAIDRGFKGNNVSGGHVVIPKWIYNCLPSPIGEFPKKDNGDDKPTFKVFCTTDKKLVVPRDFIEPELLAVTADTLKLRKLKVTRDTCEAVTNVGFIPPPTAPGNLGETVPVYVTPDTCQLVVPVEPKVPTCGAKVGTVISGEDEQEQLNLDIAGNDGDDETLSDLVCLEVEYTNNSDCRARLEFQSSQSITVEIQPNSFFQFGHDISGGFAGGNQFDPAGSQTPGFFNKSDHPVCQTFTTLHNNCICLAPGATATYKAEPFYRAKNDGSTGKIISYQTRSRVCWETI